MRTFTYERASDPADAARLASASKGSGAGASPRQAATAAYLAGGTTLFDLMKLGSMAPERVVDINDLSAAHSAIEARGGRVRFGALVKMSAAAEHPEVTKRLPVVAQSLSQAASAQIRNMATLGGNVLQRTRCEYFRDPSWTRCNKRSPGSGCEALTAVNRAHAVLGVSDKCVAAYPGDFGTALAALGAEVEISGAQARSIPFEALHLESSADGAPLVETSLWRGDVITGISVKPEPWFARSIYVKVRDRQSYEFALASAAVALDIRDGKVADARVGLGGVAYRPWRSRDAENALKGRALDEASAMEAGRAAFARAKGSGDNEFKIELGRRALTRALLAAGAMET